MKNNIEKSLQVKTWPSDKPLFKYLKKEYAAKLFDYGELHIGALYDFRNCEAYGGNRGDKDEGKKAIYEFVDDIVIKDREHNPLSPFTKQYISIKEGAKNTRLVNGSFTQRHDCEDCYIYCMSEKHNKVLYDVFEADTCIRIKSPYKFMRALYLVLKE
ncbi:MAG: hypothetical protein M1561_06160, partial [Gammaproteobacteria bacterium]|nr:hypothetical protein [Gammaproteobacteria bacterium]